MNWWITRIHVRVQPLGWLPCGSGCPSKLAMPYVAQGVDMPQGEGLRKQHSKETKWVIQGRIRT